MEKISNIVRGNSRVAAVDLKSSSAVRPGMPSYGRPVGEASVRLEREGTTASRAADLSQQLKDQRRSSQDRVVEQMADKFFMSRTNRLAEVVTAMPKEEEAVALAKPLPSEAKTAALEANVEAHESIDAAPEEYTPRGSYVDVRA